jgi:hypothetical protein
MRSFTALSWEASAAGRYQRRRDDTPLAEIGDPAQHAVSPVRRRSLVEGRPQGRGMAGPARQVASRGPHRGEQTLHPFSAAAPPNAKEVVTIAQN